MYRTIDTVLWSDPVVRQLAATGKLLFVYLITNAHSHVSGIYYLPWCLIVEETGLSLDEIRWGIDTLSSAGLIRFDSERTIVWVRNMFRYQGRGEKMLRAAAVQLKSLHKSPLIKDFVAEYPAVKRFYKDRVSKGHPELAGVGIQEQEQEQEQYTPPTPPTGGIVELLPKSFDVPEFKTAWSDMEAHRKALRVKKYTPQGLSQLARKLIGWGVDRSIAAIRNSIAHNWQGIFESKDKPHGTRTDMGRNSRIDAPDGKYDGIGERISTAPVGPAKGAEPKMRS